MRLSLYLFLLSTLLTHLHAAEYGTLVSQPSGLYQIASDKVTLHQGDILEVIGVISDGELYRLAVKDSRLPVGIFAQHNGELANIALADTTRLDNNKVIVGPAEIFILQLTSSTVNDYYRVSYKLTRRPDPKAVSTPPAN